ncbi:CAMK family protein kinase [Tritrichomonas foetus]|uniref:CAMK family protein kinase n=1 Tax=Tritrichomonas foetus TaxID=1144522 RepID=A0A1J4KRE4_9EUKA|nr:CAMK family protein kinase [Tritrichomonas foetus]|eukprot:OHT13666.1 CAMK family protein kinase [Tritrichomonas foetus]
MINKKNLPVTLKDFTFHTCIGKGGTAEIFLADSKKFNCTFVAKVIEIPDKNSTMIWKMINAEITSLSVLNHSNIIKCYDNFQIEKQYVIIMEYCPNGTLSNFIPSDVGLDFQVFRPLAYQIVDALAFCHSKSIAHRDIKLSNIFIDSYRRMKLADFGLSVHAIQCAKGTHFCGSLVYTAPEILKLKANSPFKADVWSLGVMYFVMLTGQSPWAGKNTDEIKEKIMKGELNITKQLPERALLLINKMVVVDPDQRISIDQVKSDQLFEEYRNVSPQKRYLPNLCFGLDKKRASKPGTSSPLLTNINCSNASSRCGSTVSSNLRKMRVKSEFRHCSSFKAPRTMISNTSLKKAHTHKLSSTFYNIQ